MPPTGRVETKVIRLSLTKFTVTKSVKLLFFAHSTTTHGSDMWKKERNFEASLITTSFFGCFPRYFCLTTITLLVPTRYAVKTPPDGLSKKQTVSRASHRMSGVHSPAPILTMSRYDLQPCPDPRGGAQATGQK